LPNGAFYTELDERLRNSHNTLMSLRAKSAQQPQEASSDEDTVALRNEVNQR
jgi:ribosomal protein L29